MTSILKFLRGFFAIVAPIVIILLHFVVMLAFINRWDEVVAITLIPIWIWAAVGMLLSLVAWAGFKSRLSLLTFFIWMLTGIICADETPGLLREFRSAISNKPATKEEETEHRKFRIVSFNCEENNNVAAAQEIIALEPDIVLLQESPSKKDLQKLARELFDNESSLIVNGGCAILSRGELTEIFKDEESGSVGATLELRNGNTIDIINLHLEQSVSRYDIYKSSTWQEMTNLRIANRAKLRQLIRQLPERVVEKPTIIGGDFGTPPGDDLFRSLKPEYQDSFGESGEGWGNTWPNKSSIVRIDQIWTNELLKPKRSFTIRSQHSDHRLVVTDFQLVKPEGTLALNIVTP